jgi:hypothetical protein
VKTIPLCLALLLSSSALAADDQPASSLKEALGDGEARVQFRYRYESVDEDAFEKDAYASTLRTALSYRTKPWKGFSLFLEAEDVHDIGAGDNHNNGGFGSLSNGVTDRPTILDPEDIEVNQAHLRIEQLDTRFDLGRREIGLGDQRFVGPVGWRQNHQSFDAFLVENDSLESTTFLYSYLWQVNRVSGEPRQMDSHLLDVRHDLGFAELALYGYLLDFDRPDVFVLSTDTFGFQLKGRHEMAERTDLLWEVELADQSDAGDNPGRVDALYTYLRAGATLDAWTFELGWEVFEGSPEDGVFQTPLATLHLYNGWADKFLSTPANGLEDLHLRIKGSSGDFSWLAAYHDFSAENTSDDYGSELDLRIQWKSSWEQTFSIDAAFYDADTHATDTTKIFIWTAYEL